MKLKYIIILFILLAGLGALIYSTPDDAYWIREDPLYVIDVGRSLAYDLLEGNKNDLLKMSIDPATTKIKMLNFKSISDEDVFKQFFKNESDLDLIFKDKKQNYLFEYVRPLLSSTESKMELVSLEQFKKDNNVISIITFAYTVYTSSGEWKILEIPNGGKFLFTIGLIYDNPSEYKPKLLRKIANLPVIRLFIEPRGFTGRWLLFDYKYKYNKYDYFNWLINNAEEYVEMQIQKDKQLSLDWLDKLLVYWFNASTSPKIALKYVLISAIKHREKLNTFFIEQLHKSIEDQYTRINEILDKMP